MSLCRQCAVVFRRCQAPVKQAWGVMPVRGAFFSRENTSTAGTEEGDRRKIHEEDGNLTKMQLHQLASRSRTLTAHRPYSPPSDVDSRVEAIVRQLTAPQTSGDWRQTSLLDARLKYKVLTKLIHEFDHDIPGFTMTAMETVQDAVNYFHIGVKETATLEEMKSSSLPPNMHINTEPVRFNPETDTMFGGRTAFPGQDTHVTSIKYKRKYETIRTKKPKPGFENHYYNY